jgi:hypothetical protein
MTGSTARKQASGGASRLKVVLPRAGRLWRASARCVVFPAVGTIFLFASTAASAQPSKSQPTSLIRTIRTFLRTDVCRQARFCPRYDPAIGYELVAPELRGGETLAEWKTGSTPIAPCDHDRVKLKRLRRDSGRPTFSVALRGMPGGSCGAGWAMFLLGLRRIHGHWRVSYWGPAPVFQP